LEVANSTADTSSLSWKRLLSDDRGQISFLSAAQHATSKATSFKSWKLLLVYIRIFWTLSSIVVCVYTASKHFIYPDILSASLSLLYSIHLRDFGLSECTILPFKPLLAGLPLPFVLTNVRWRLYEHSQHLKASFITTTTVFPAQRMGYPKATANPVMIYKRQAEVDDGTLEDCEPDDTAVMYALPPELIHS